jgi:hypothetical protein
MESCRRWGSFLINGIVRRHATGGGFQLQIELSVCRFGLVLRWVAFSLQRAVILADGRGCADQHLHLRFECRYWSAQALASAAAGSDSPPTPIGLVDGLVPNVCWPSRPPKFRASPRRPTAGSGAQKSAHRRCREDLVMACLQGVSGELLSFTEAAHSSESRPS